MKPPAFEYARPATVAEAVACLTSAQGDAKILAGGQSLVPLLNFRLASPKLLVDMNRVEGLAGIAVVDGQLRIGAMTRTRRLEVDPIVRDSFPGLSAAASWVGHVQIRNRGTVGGSLAHADPAAELPAMCLLYEAEVIAVGPNGERRIACEDLALGFLTTSLAEDEILTEIRVPAPPAGEGWGFREFAPRRGDFALAGAATRIGMSANGTMERPMVVVFGTSDRPARMAEAEALLDGRPPTEASLGDAARLAADTIAAEDPRPDAAYRRRLMSTLIQRALLDASAIGADR